jgi:predicted phosphodiesterase
MTDLTGLLFIGDPHVADYPPGFRRDDYPAAILGKLRWCLRHAAENRLLPVLLGDLFHYPRDNSNRLLVELLTLLPPATPAIAGNHDCSEDALCDADTLSVLAAAGRVRLLDRSGPWTGEINGVRVALGGTAWGQRLPEAVSLPEAPELVFWVAHHDLRFAGYGGGRIPLREIPGVDLLVNGHIHQRLEPVTEGRTTWMNPGNISRINRGDASRSHVPGVLAVAVARTAGRAEWSAERIAVPHRPFDEAFHPQVPDAAAAAGESVFVRSLAELLSRKTAGGEGLDAFLDANLPQFEPRVAAEIRALRAEVRSHAAPAKEGTGRAAEPDGSRDAGNG